MKTVKFFSLLIIFILLLGIVGTQTQTVLALSILNVDNGNPAACSDTIGTPYCTIQAAIDAANPGDIINLAAGIYTENVIVTKSVEIAGAGQESTIVMPAVSNANPCSGSSLCGGTASNVFLVQANDVNIHDLTVDGDNTTLTSGIIRDGADLDARNGIIKDLSGTFNNLEVYNTNVTNIYLRGIYSTSGTFNFHHNTVTNVQGDYYSIGIFAWYGPGIMSNNVVSHANDAISANHSKGIQFLNNTVAHSGSGVHTDNAGDSAGSIADLIQGNNVSDCTPGGYGVWVFVPYIAPTVDNNTISNCSVGLSAWGQANPDVTQFTNNTVNGPSGEAGSVGVYLTTDWIYWGYSDLSVTFSGNLITGNETGIYLTADQQTWNPQPYVAKTITASFLNNQITNNTTGLDKGTTGTYNVNATHNWWGSPFPVWESTIAENVTYDPWYLDAEMTILSDSVPTTVFVDDDFTTSSAGGHIFGYNAFDSVQEGIDAVAASGTVNVAAGSYFERVLINKPLDLRGAQFEIDPTTVGARANPANESIIDVTSLGYANPDIAVEILNGVTDVSLDGFTLIGDPTNTLADTSVVRVGGSAGSASNISIKNNIIDGMYGIIFKGGNALIADQNRVVVNKVGVAVQPNPVSNVTISKNVFSLGTAPAGGESAIYLTNCSSCNVTYNQAVGFVGGNGLGGSNLNNLTISENTFTGNKKAVNLWGNTTFVDILNNVLSNSLELGINIKGQDILIQGNQINNNALGGIKIDSQTLETQGVAIHRNNISGNTNNGLEVTSLVTENVNAICNWWGAATGPSGAGSGSGDSVYGNVTFLPWLITSHLDGPCATPPLLVTAADDAFGYEGDTLTASGEFSGVGLTLAADNIFGIFTDNGDGTWSWSLATTDNVIGTITVTATDAYGKTATDSFEFSAANIAPTVSIDSVSPAVIAVGASVTANGSFTDPGTSDTHTAVWDWGDTSSSNGTVSGFNVGPDSHVYSAPGIYTLKLTVTDDDGGVGTSTFEFVVVYDPSGGFVTGGGWIWSPTGAYTADPALEGKATFGFVSKYKKGADIPEGNTEFQFKAGDLNFRSTSYQWLVVNQGGTNAQFKGYGTINDAGNYGFMLWAGDGSPDTFRIRIWEADTEVDVYDNGPDQAIGGGSIVVHKAK